MAFSEHVSTALSVLIGRHPFVASLVMTLHKIVETEGAEIPTAATDEKNIYVNSPWLKTMDHDEGAFVFGHEALHTAFLHLTRAKEYDKMGIGPDAKRFDPDLWNEAADYVVNAILVAGGMKAPKSALLDRRFTETSLVDEVYTELNKQERKKKKCQGGNSGNNPGQGFDKHMKPSPQAPTEMDVKGALIQAAMTAKSMGKMPGSFERLVKAATEVKTDWRKVLRTLLNQVAGKDELSWSRINRRKLVMASLLEQTGQDMIMLPGQTGFQMDNLVIGIDTSGSIGEHELSVFLAEAAAILTDVRPRSIHVVWADSKVAGVDEVTDPIDLEHLTPKGGGGTHMPVIFDWIDQEQITPDAVVILTDGYTDFGSPQPWPVIWACSTDRQASHGTTLRVEL